MDQFMQHQVVMGAPVQAGDCNQSGEIPTVIMQVSAHSDESGGRELNEVASPKRMIEIRAGSGVQDRDELLGGHLRGYLRHTLDCRSRPPAVYRRRPYESGGPSGI